MLHITSDKGNINTEHISFPVTSFIKLYNLIITQPVNLQGNKHLHVLALLEDKTVCSGTIKILNIYASNLASEPLKIPYNQKSGLLKDITLGLFFGNSKKNQ